MNDAEAWMPPDSATGLQQTWAQVRGFAFPLLIVTSILVIIAPLPPLMLCISSASGDVSNLIFFEFFVFSTASVNVAKWQ